MLQHVSLVKSSFRNMKSRLLTIIKTIFYLFSMFVCYSAKMKKNRNCQSGWWVVLLTATLAVQVSAEAGVGLYNSKLKQVTTSSTLRWTSLKKESMSNYVVGAESDQGNMIHNIPKIFDPLFVSSFRLLTSIFFSRSDISLPSTS